jgi:hypothetical protein
VPDGDAAPGTLTGVAGAEQTVTAETDDAGVAAFAWQPGFGGGSGRSDVLTIELPDTDEAPITVTAQLDPPGSRKAGIHVREIRFFSGRELLNDEVYGFDELGGDFPGIAVGLDAPVDQASVQGKPVVRLLLELPWPVGREFAPFGSATSVWARRTIEIVGETNADGPLIIWTPGRPQDDLRLDGVLEQVIASLRQIPEHTLFEPPLPLLLRFQIDGWAVTGERNDGRERLHLNGHTDTFVDDAGRTRLVLPSTDEVTGGRFETWFWFTGETPPPGRRFEVPGRLFTPGRLDLTRFGTNVARILTPMTELAVVPRPTPIPVPDADVTPLPLADVAGRTLGFVERRAADAGLTLDVVEEDAAGLRRNTVLGAELLAGNVLRVRVSRGAGGRG